MLVMTHRYRLSKFCDDKDGSQRTWYLDFRDP